LVELSEQQFADEARFLAAAELFEMGKLSPVRMPRLASVAGAEFLCKLGV
jgi:hypothetical protein